jgi:Holliday junction DNA helicase RuvA
MIAQIKGKLQEKEKDCVIIDVNGICYRVIIPPILFNRLNEVTTEDGYIRLVTYHYLQADPSRSHPVLIGFLNEIEKDFFEQFIKVSGIGPRAAVKAFNRPISDIARAIDEGNINLLRSLPGIGMQRAKEVIAKLQGRVGKFGLIQDREIKDVQPQDDWQEEALQVLLQLQYKKQEAKEMLKKALARAPHINNAEELLNEVYRQKVER